MTVLPLGDVLRAHADEKEEGSFALIYPQSSLTWRELESRAECRARVYRERGVTLNDLVIVALHNSPAFHETVFAIWKLGATPVLVSPHLPAREFHAIRELVEPRLAIGDSSDPASHSFFERDAAKHDMDRMPASVPKYWKAVCSGGSTGRPKVIVDHMRGEINPRDPRIREPHLLPANGVVLNPGPLYHNGPFLFTSLALLTGSCVIGMERFDAEETLRLIEKHRVNWVCLVPTMMHRIWSLPPAVREKYDLSSLQTVWHMAAPCPVWLKRNWIEWLGPHRIWERYAGTEGFGRTKISGQEWLKKPGSVGRAASSQEVKIVHEDGSECPIGTVGEIFFLPEGGVAPSHYIGAEARRDPQGWYSMGDLGFIDRDGYLFLSDRRTDLILRGGANIYPAEIEAILDSHPSIASSVVIGLPCDELGARIHALIEPRPGCALDLDHVHRFLGDQLAKNKLPESYEITTQALRDDAGKVRRSAIREERLAWLNSGRPFQVIAGKGDTHSTGNNSVSRR